MGDQDAQSKYSLEVLTPTEAKISQKDYVHSYSNFTGKAVKKIKV